MPDDVNNALERFKTFLGSFGMDAVIDQNGGFTTSDGHLLIGEIEMAMAERRSEEDRPHDLGL
ncbi:hypothetical protein [uncultured Sphingobium sp.]|uniref:hypothetical protein n=1 Tax=uncultured Sphingobium sp. TaxID=316087 RepID=UPI00259B28BB|nr:hypothetical protein [uncultured Sphingobium sp.]